VKARQYILLTGYTMDSHIKKLLSKLIRDPVLEELELKLKKPNLFYILKFQTAEIRHSNFLAWLLNPTGSHGLGDLFLKRFLKDIFSSKVYDWIDEFSVDQLDLSSVEIRRERENIDLLLIFNHFVICVENKIGAHEHSNQLHKYVRVSKSLFPNHKRAFVYLTPYGMVPAERKDAEVYQVYSYYDLSRQIESLLELHGDSLPLRIRHYIEDYLVVIRREIMKEDAANSLAKKIYNSHREAFDFIFENKPDRLSEVASIFEKLVKESGWVLATCNKGYTRFLTKELYKIIPRSGVYGWKGREAFLFEIDYWPKSINCKTVIAPGDDDTRAIIGKAFNEIEGAAEPRGKQWLVHFNKKWSFDVTKHTDEEIKKKLGEIWSQVEELVTKVEAKLLEDRWERSILSMHS